MPKDRTFTIPLPHFNYKVVVAFTEDFKEYAKSVKWQGMHNDIKDDARSVVAYTAYSPDDCCSWILLGHDPSIKTIAHEVFHVVWRIMKHIGAEFEDEVMAYHQGYLVGEIADNLYKYGAAYEDIREVNKKKKLDKAAE